MKLDKSRIIGKLVWNHSTTNILFLGSAISAHATPFNNQTGDTRWGNSWRTQFHRKTRWIKTGPRSTTMLPPGGECRRPDVNVSQMAATLTMRNVREDQPPCYGQEATVVSAFRSKCLSGRALASSKWWHFTVTMSQLSSLHSKVLFR